MNARPWPAPALLALGLGLLAPSLAARAAPADEALTAAKVAAEWRCPGAAEAGVNGDPSGPKLQLEAYDPAQPFDKVWQFYAKKCGLDAEYAEGKVYQTNGADRAHGRYVVYDQVDDKGRRLRSHFAYRTERYTVAVVIAPGPDGKHTAVAVTATVP